MRNQLKHLTGLSETVRKQMNLLSQQDCDLQLQIERVRVAIIRDEKLLTKKPWQYCPCDYRGVTFSLNCMGNWHDFPELLELLKPDYHDGYPMAWWTWEERLAKMNDDARVRMIASREKRSPHSDEYWEEKSIELHFSDGDMSFNHDDDAQMLQFIKDFGLEVDFSRLTEQKTDLEKQLASVTSTLAMVQEKFQ